MPESRGTGRPGAGSGWVGYLGEISRDLADPRVSDGAGA